MEDKDNTMLKNNILAAYQFRHATKAFDPSKKISAEDFQFILETGRLSPSSFGFEPWRFIVLQNQEIREKLRSVASGSQQQLASASHFLLILARQPKDMTADSAYIQEFMKNVQQLPPEVQANKSKVYDRFLRTGFRLLENERAMFEWACRQTYLAVGNMLTAAAQIGIDSCPIEGFDKAGVEAILIEEGILDTEHFGIACMAAFGYRLNEQPVKTRQTADQIIQWV